jgi:hypothetical protein
MVPSQVDGAHRDGVKPGRPGRHEALVKRTVQAEGAGSKQRPRSG